MYLSPFFQSRKEKKFNELFLNFQIPLRVKKTHYKSNKKLTLIGMCRCIFSCSGMWKRRCNFSSNLRSHKWGIINKRFHVLEKKRRSSIELSKNISERRSELIWASVDSVGQHQWDEPQRGATGIIRIILYCFCRKEFFLTLLFLRL